VVREGDIVIPKISSAEPLKEQIAQFLECCESGARPETDGVSGRAVVSVLEAASRSMRQGGAPIAVDDVLVPSA
jgi:hypothetical protein